MEDLMKIHYLEQIEGIKQSIKENVATWEALLVQNPVLQQTSIRDIPTILPDFEAVHFRSEVTTTLRLAKFYVGGTLSNDMECEGFLTRLQEIFLGVRKDNDLPNIESLEDFWGLVQRSDCTRILRKFEDLEIKMKDLNQCKKCKNKRKFKTF